MTEHISKQSTVALLPETGGDVICARYSGIVTRKDYELIYTTVKNKVDAGQKFRLLINFEPNFQGWEEDAADLNFKSIIEFAYMAIKIAYVNPPQGKILQMKLMQPTIGGVVKNFESNEFDKALAWLKQD